MNSIVSIAVISLLILIPGYSYSSVENTGNVSEDSWNENVLSSDEENVSNSKIEEAPKNDKKKGKKSKVDEITINEVFYYSMAINLLSVILLIILVYYPGNRKSEQVFTFILFNVTIFLITYILNQVKISMGAAFGLFAVFSMLRYRTRSITMKDMTYLFVFIALGLINAVQLRYDVMAMLNAFVIIIVWILDSNLLFRYEYSKSIQYDQIDMIKPENHENLLADLRKRTGLNISRFEITRVNFLRDTVTLRVFYRESPGGIYSVINGKKRKNE